MTFIQQPLYILTVLLLLILLSEWLAGKKGFKHIGAVLLVILFAALLANLGILPSSQNAPPVYDGIFHYAAPLGIFFLLLQVQLKDLKKAGLPMIVMFLLGSATTIAGVLIGYAVLSPQYHSVRSAYAVAGMYTGTYTGGSANLNAVAFAYGVNKDGTLFAAVNAADNIITTVWMMATIALPIFFRRRFPRRQPHTQPATANAAEETPASPAPTPVELRLTDLVVLLALGFGTLLLSEAMATRFPGLPAILVLTTVALVLAQWPVVQRLQGAKVLGYGLILLFLAVVGAYCDVKALAASGGVALTLLGWVTAIVFIHGALLFLIGGLLRQDWDILAIASNANIGGATSAPVCAASIGRPDLQLPGLLAGSLGNALGTYLGFVVAEFLK